MDDQEMDGVEGGGEFQQEFSYLNILMLSLNREIYSIHFT